MPGEKPRTQFNLLLNSQEHIILHELAKQENMTKGAYLRKLLLAADAMDKGIPVCSNGTRCYVPQMHMTR